MPASSQASSELSTASLTAVSRAFLGLSKPSRCLFFAKNSLTDMSRCFAAMDSAVTARRFGCSPVSLTFGIFVCSSILPDFTLVLPCPQSTRANAEDKAAAFNGPEALSLVRHPRYLDASTLFWSCVDFTSDWWRSTMRFRAALLTVCALLFLTAIRGAAQCGPKMKKQIADVRDSWVKNWS